MATAIRALDSAAAAAVVEVTIVMDHREPEDDVGSSIYILPPCERCIVKLHRQATSMPLYETYSSSAHFFSHGHLTIRARTETSPSSHPPSPTYTKFLFATVSEMASPFSLGLPCSAEKRREKTKLTLPWKGPVTDYGATIVHWMRHRQPRYKGSFVGETERPSNSYIVDVGLLLRSVANCWLTPHPDAAAPRQGDKPGGFGAYAPSAFLPQQDQAPHQRGAVDARGQEVVDRLQ